MSFADAIESLFQGKETAIARDLKLNFKKLATDSKLAADEAALLTLALATALDDHRVVELAETQLAGLDVSAEQVREAREAAAIMGLLNKYYRFRHMLETTRGQEGMQADYRGAGLRMNSLAKPALGKERFELLALAVSVVNGCEACITSHEAELRRHGVEVDKIHDAARLASVLSGIRALA